MNALLIRPNPHSRACNPFCRRKTLTPRPLPILHVREQELEAVAQRPHIGIHVPLELERLGHDFHGPALQLRVLPGFEAEEEIARVFGVDAEGVDGSFGVRFRVGG